MLRPSPRFFAAALTLLGAVVFTSASCSGGGESSSGTAATSTGTNGQGGAGQGGDNVGGFVSNGGNGQGGSGGACEPPDVLVLLDRTLTMHFMPDGTNPTDAPDYKSSKWYQAVTAIEQMVAPPLDQGIRYGLSLWPRDPGGDACVTLAERVMDTKTATNPACEAAEVPISPALGTGAAIQAYLDPATTKLCLTTPTGNALLSAKDHLKGIAAPGRDQYIVLVTDGADWDQSCPEPDPMPIVQDLLAQGIKTFVVGFSASGEFMTGGVGAEFLNNMACAGGTAKGFPAPCTQQNGVYTATDPKAAQLYLKAGSATELSLALKAVSGKLCCNCADSCDPPEVLIALDRTLTMHKRPDGTPPTDGPDYQSSKWYQAITAIEKMVAAPKDQGVRFGLELWPRDPGGGACNTLAQQVTMSKPATNTPCEAGEIIVSPALGAGGAIQSALDPATTLLCTSTPTGKGLFTAADHLLKSASPGRDQYVVLVTDGADWDASCPDPNPLPIVQDLAAAGIKTFVVGFSAEGAVQPGGVGAEFLNNLACAGQTAKGFPNPCTQTPSGYVATNPKGDVLYLAADNATALEAALSGVTVDLCCDCVK